MYGRHVTCTVGRVTGNKIFILFGPIKANLHGLRVLSANDLGNHHHLKMHQLQKTSHQCHPGSFHLHGDLLHQVGHCQLMPSACWASAHDVCNRLLSYAHIPGRWWMERWFIKMVLVMRFWFNKFADQNNSDHWNNWIQILIYCLQILMIYCLQILFQRFCKYGQKLFWDWYFWGQKCIRICRKQSHNGGKFWCYSPDSLHFFHGRPLVLDLASQSNQWWSLGLIIQDRDLIIRDRDRDRDRDLTIRAETTPSETETFKIRDRDQHFFLSNIFQHEKHHFFTAKGYWNLPPTECIFHASIFLFSLLQVLWSR